MNRERMYDLIRGPVVTEKSTRGSEFNQVTFRVPLNATKPEIKAAIEQCFEVKVTGVNTLRVKGKVKRFQGRLGSGSATIDIRTEAGSIVLQEGSVRSLPSARPPETETDVETTPAETEPDVETTPPDTTQAPTDTTQAPKIGRASCRERV